MLLQQQVTSQKSSDQRLLALFGCVPLTDTVELCREDLEDNQAEAELSQTGSNVGPFKGSLCRTNLDELLRAENDGASTVEPQVVAAGCVTGLAGR